MNQLPGIADTARSPFAYSHQCTLCCTTFQDGGAGAKIIYGICDACIEKHRLHDTPLPELTVVHDFAEQPELFLQMVRGRAKRILEARKALQLLPVQTVRDGWREMQGAATDLFLAEAAETQSGQNLPRQLEALVEIAARALVTAHACVMGELEDSVLLQMAQMAGYHPQSEGGAR